MLVNIGYVILFRVSDSMKLRSKFCKEEFFFGKENSRFQPTSDGLTPKKVCPLSRTTFDETSGHTGHSELTCIGKYLFMSIKILYRY